MKKYASLILAVAICFTIVSCAVLPDEASSGSQMSTDSAQRESTVSPDAASQPTESTEAPDVTVSDPNTDGETPKQPEENPMKETQFYIKANGKTLVADFADNSSADAFRELLRKGDLTVDMHDYGDFEKVGEIGHTLPQNNTQITTSPGDVILYLGTNITIYYDQNSWNFTRLGSVQNMTRQTMLDFFGGKGNASVTFSLNK